MSTIDSELKLLEQEIDKLIKSREQLTLQNKSLSKKIEELKTELLTSHEKKNRAINIIQIIITQLKDILQCQTK